jgi:hypothetical protein
MKKLLAFALIAVLAGLGIGVGVAWLRRPPAPDAAALAADSTAHAAAADSLHSDSMLPSILTPPLDSLGADSAVAADSSAPHPPLPASLPAGAAPKPQAAAAALADSSAPAAAVLGAQRDTVGARFARMLGALKPAEAAQVLQQLDDVSARRVLLQLPERKAALILAALPRDRAGAIAKALLQPTDG